MRAKSPQVQTAKVQNDADLAADVYRAAREFNHAIDAAHAAGLTVEVDAYCRMFVGDGPRPNVIVKVAIPANEATP